jgi:hypothetical protein
VDPVDPDSDPDPQHWLFPIQGCTVLFKCNFEAKVYYFSQVNLFFFKLTEYGIQIRGREKCRIRILLEKIPDP